ncbi:MAG: type II toxin-antitoxin system RelE/ParE family toxin [Gammaproteobacteria bacterium]
MAKTHVRISTNFDRTLDGVKAFLEEAEPGHTFLALLDALFDRLIPNLQRHPRLGRDFLARTPGSVEGRMIHQRLSRQIGRGELREYILGDYLVPARGP